MRTHPPVGRQPALQPVLVAVETEVWRSIVRTRTPAPTQGTLRLEGLSFLDLLNNEECVLVSSDRTTIASRCLFVTRRGACISLTLNEGTKPTRGIKLEHCYLRRPFDPSVKPMSNVTGRLKVTNCVLAGGGYLNLEEASKVAIEATAFVRVHRPNSVFGLSIIRSERNLFAHLQETVNFYSLDHSDIEIAKAWLPSYSGRNNLYFDCKRFAPDLAPKSAGALAVWQQFTNNGEKSPVLADPQFARPDLVAQCRQRLLPPSAFRLRPTSPARRRKIGCDVSKLPDLPPALIDRLPADMRPPE